MAARKGFQKGSLCKRGKSWVAQFWDDGHRRKQTLGRCSEMTKAEAQRALAAILAPINSREVPASPSFSLAEFIERPYFPFYKRKWKRSTAMSNEDRIRHHVVAELGASTLGSFNRDQLQAFLDRKGESGLSFSVVDHLRWDLKQIFTMAVAEGYIARNPAQLLFTPRDCPRAETKIMNFEEVRKLFTVLNTREQLIAKLAVLAGMRPGEIFALTWRRLEKEYADIKQRVYRGDIDSPKSTYSVRWAALSDGLLSVIRDWRSVAIDSSPEAWVFPSENLKTPLRKDNCWRRHFAPQLKAVGLSWVNFQVMRRTHSSLLKELDVDPKIRAEQMGHTVDVNENTYTRTSLERRREAVNKLERALSVN
jgi:integrase